jgi:signal transduction histidine kinase
MGLQNLFRKCIRWRRSHELRFRLTALLLAASLLIFIVTTGIIITRATTVMKEDANRELKVSNAMIAAHVTTWMDAHVKALHNLALLPDIVSMKPERQRPILQKMASAYPYMYIVSTTDIDGKNIIRSDDKAPIDYSDRQWFLQAKQKRTVAYQSVVSRTINKPSLVISMPICGEEGKILGVAMIGIDIDSISRQVSSLHIGRTGFAYMVDENNIVLAQPASFFANEKTLINLGAYPPVKELRAGKRGPVMFTDAAGNQWRAFIDTLNNGWGILVQQRDSEYSDTRSFFMKAAATVFLCAVLILVASVWRILRKTLDPVGALSGVVGRVASDMESRPDFSEVRSICRSIHTGDEIGVLAASFDTMSSRLESTLSNLEAEIAKRKNAQEDLHKLNEELEQRVNERTRMLESVNKELNDFAFIVSHDLKAPLRAVGQLARWISEDYSTVLDANGKKQIELLLARVKRMSNLIDGVLRYSRASRMTENQEPVNLHRLAQEVIAVLAPPANIRIRIEGELPTLLGNRVHFEQVFQNLIGNAIKHMDKPEGLVVVRSNDMGREYKFTIEDNGPGIEEKYFAKIFQIFQTLKSRDELESTGIGLTLVKKIVEAYGGAIWVESAVGKGSCFIFTIPKERKSA